MTEKRKTSALKQAVYYRNYRRARDSALVRLSKLHPDDYRRLLGEEKRRYEQEGKTWLDISGRTDAGLGVSTAHSATDKDANGLGNHSQARNVGAEA